MLAMPLFANPDLAIERIVLGNPEPVSWMSGGETRSVDSGALRSEEYRKVLPRRRRLRSARSWHATGCGRPSYQEREVGRTTSRSRRRYPALLKPSDASRIRP